MNVSILTVFESLYTPFLSTSIIAKAQQKGLVTVAVREFSAYAQPKERIDEPSCGPGSGMLLKPEIVEQAINERESAAGKAFKIFFSPQGTKLDQRVLKDIYTKITSQGLNHLLLVAARYEGIDQRVEDYYADEVLSVGDFVLMGGDLPAMLFLESFLRLIPHVIGKTESVEQDSFTAHLVDYPEYALPVEWKGLQVPEIVRSGNHQAIARWRRQQAVKKTVLQHFEWLRNWQLTAQEKEEAATYIPPHYVVLMHDQVLVGPERNVGTTSVTSIDIHDIARSARTFGCKGFFIVTPLLDQQKIVEEFLQFWQEGHGISYNPNRHQAVNQVHIKSSLSEVQEYISNLHEGKKPFVLVTSAKPVQEVPSFTFYDQATVWRQERPVLIVLGTGQGLAPALTNQADGCLIPVEGFSSYNHLSVRSAAAIIFDRWLGVQPKRFKSWQN